MQEARMTRIKENAPWRRGVGWPIVGIEGLLLVVIGMYMFADQDGAAEVVRQLIAVVLLVNGAVEILAGFRDQGSPVSPFRTLRGSVGATIGTLVVLENFSDYLDPNGARVILAVGLLISGLIGLVASVLTRSYGGIRVGAVVSGVVMIVLGIILFSGDADDPSRLNLMATIALVFGLLLIAYAYFLYKGKNTSTLERPKVDASSKDGKPAVVHNDVPNQKDMGVSTPEGS